MPWLADTDVGAAYGFARSIDVSADDGSRCRYCLAEWVQSGRSAAYTFLYRV
jgi:hypothetical protein